jgi:hypothetical protein
LLKAIDNSVQIDVLRCNFEYQLALVSNSKVSVEETQQRAADALFDLHAKQRPWLAKTREERAAQEKEDFASQWKELAGFDPFDKDALSNWAEELAKVTADKSYEREKADREEQERQESFQKKVEEIRLKRLKQQGRG